MPQLEPGRDILSTLRLWKTGCHQEPARAETDDDRESGTSPSGSPCCWPSRPWLPLSPTASCRSCPSSAARASRSIAGNQNVATRAAEEIRRYVVTNAALLKALAADLQDTGLETWQQDRILKNYVLQFREFREITLFDEAGAHDRHEPRRASRAWPSRRTRA